eukprot:CAMPEP_0178480572 /NCGR_PEP_ID=MMETSP0696-20121128/5767_1 /TAXON_ID=265572 /ORGANISM="Extubocellulus spinifer, Strain CCMP396" /LENGTH=355 /DNA_ID=CAMNT_0020108021 /DNA_START=86 /DNA_END=1153 /DNA_ORIENTATION=-
MSDFAGLLGNLKQSAQRVKEDTTAGRSTTGSSDGGRRKGKQQQYQQRKRPAGFHPQDHSGSSAAKRRRTPREPADKRELTLSISFLCIGAQKSGTTWLHELLSKHPSLCLPAEKEVHFWDWNRRKGLGWYCRQFTRGRDGNADVRYGECTPCYITLPESDIEEVRTLFPKVKLIFIARDPVDRAWSALLMELRNAVRGVEVGKFSINDRTDNRHLEQMDKESNPDKYDDTYFMDRLRHSTHRDRCDYASGLQRWLKYFDDKQLLIIDYNEIAQNPRETLEKICWHIGVDSKALLDLLSDQELRKRKNAAVGSTKDKQIRPSLRKKMEAHLRPAAISFNKLLQQLGYTDFRVSEYK